VKLEVAYFVTSYTQIAQVGLQDVC